VVQISVDDVVYAEIQRRAVPFVDKEPNDTLRRVLGIDTPVPALTAAPARTVTPRRGQREQKVQLSALVAAGLLVRGERLACVDYGGQPVPGGVAEVGTGNKLVMNGRHYSMSGLALELLRQAGHTVEVARGPAHWRTAGGKTVLTLWKEHVGKG
jgi:hypothetical protein